MPKNGHNPTLNLVKKILDWMFVLPNEVIYFLSNLEVSLKFIYSFLLLQNILNSVSA